MRLTVASRRQNVMNERNAGEGRTRMLIMQAKKEMVREKIERMDS